MINRLCNVNQTIYSTPLHVDSHFWELITIFQQPRMVSHNWQQLVTNKKVENGRTQVVLIAHGLFAFRFCFVFSSFSFLERTKDLSNAVDATWLQPINIGQKGFFARTLPDKTNQKVTKVQNQITHIQPPVIQTIQKIVTSLCFLSRIGFVTSGLSSLERMYVD